MNRLTKLSLSATLISLLTLSCSDAKSVTVDIKNRSLKNDAANIPSQCYTKTEDEDGKVHNPCFNCHISSSEPNYLDDWDLQESYAFAEYAQKNHWTNLFKDRTKAVAKISDKEILNYVRVDNYPDLADKLKNLSHDWDIDGDKKWDGYIPDCSYNFDDEGFDRDVTGGYSGWRAFGYYPFLGTFWPTNGSTDDVLIRLPMDFRMTKEGVFDIETYKVNLLIVEALIKQKSIKTFEIDENKYGVDLNKDGKLTTINKITFEYDLKNGKDMSYVGLAKKKGYKIAAGFYPRGTDFLHSVRYIDTDGNNSIKMAARMKELRYGKKVNWVTYTDHQALMEEELKERHDFPDRLEVFVGDAERGISNKRGWRYQGFIEDENGALRPQTYEENLMCIGCHASLGALADSTFAYQRKFEHGTFQNGWHHWSQKGLKDVKEPKTADGRDEYTLYLKENHAGDEFRDNDEVIKKFFNDDGTLKDDEVQKIKTDISHLIFPSQKRALKLNKAYKVIVDEQSFIYGRDATIKPVKNVHKELKPDQSTGVKNPVRYH
ncbi:MAG TPA: hypothetical protein EYH01_01245 [Campylobacterales bacterium]|nr:hypothetical protein [Campylobacterales bacterium]